MADAIVNVVVKAKSDVSSALANIRQQLGQLQKAANSSNFGNITNLPNALKAANDAAYQGATGIGAFESKLLNLQNTIPNVLTGLKALAAGFVGFKIFGYLENAANVAARAETLNTVLQITARNAGYTREQIETLDKQVQSMGITAISSRESLTKFLQSGLDVTQAAKLARAAQDLAVVAGEDSSETFSRLIVNIQQMDTVGLRHMGIVLNMEKAWDDYGRTLGKSGADLTAGQKQQAVLNATLAEASKLTGSYEAAMGNVGKQVQSLTRFKQELSRTIGNNLLPAYSALVEEFTLFLKNMGVMAESFGEQSDAAFEFGEAVREIARTLRETAEWIVEHRELLKELIATYIQVRVALLAINFAGTIIGGVTTAIKWVTSLITAFKALPLATQTAVRGVIAALGRLSIAVSVFLASFNFGTWLYNTFAIVQDVAIAVMATVMETLEQIKLGWLAVGAVAKGVFLSILTFSTQPLKTMQAELDAIAERIRKSQDRLRDSFEAVNKSRQAALEKETPKEKEDTDTSEEEKKARKLEALVQRRVQLNNEQLEIERRVAQFRAIGNTTAVEEAMEELKVKKEQVAQNQKYLDSLKVTNVAQRVASEEQKAAAVRELKARETAITDLRDSFKQLGLASQELNNSNVSVSEGFTKTLGSVKNLFAGFKEGVTRGMGTQEAQVNINSLKQALLKLQDAAKSPNEIAAAIEQIGTQAEHAEALVKAFRETMAFKQQKAELEELNKQLEGFLAMQSELRTNLETQLDVQTKLSAASQDYKATLVELGGSVYQGILAIGKGFAAAGDAGQLFFQSVSIANTIREQVNTAETLYQTDIENLEEAIRRKKEIIRESATDIVDRLNQEKALEKQSVEERIKIQKRYFDELVTQQKAALDKYKEYAHKVKDLEKELLDISSRKDQALFNTKLKGLNEQQKLEAKQERANELARDAQRAQEAGNFEFAKSLLEKRIDLEQELSDARAEAGQADTSPLEAAYNDLTAIVEEQRAEATAATEEQKNLVLELTESVNEAARALDGLLARNAVQIRMMVEPDTPSIALAKEQIKQALGVVTAAVQVGVEPSSLNTAWNAIQAFFADKTVAIRVLADTAAAAAGGGVALTQQTTGQTSPLKRALGGLITGMGTNTSDSIHVMASHEEFMMQAAAVRKYGVDFMNAVNLGIFNPMANLNLSTISEVSGGSSLHPVHLHFPFGDFDLFGTPDQTQTLHKGLRVAALKKGNWKKS